MLLPPATHAVWLHAQEDSGFCLVSLHPLVLLRMPHAPCFAVPKHAWPMCFNKFVFCATAHSMIRAAIIRAQLTPPPPSNGTRSPSRIPSSPPTASHPPTGHSHLALGARHASPTRAQVEGDARPWGPWSFVWGWMIGRPFLARLCALTNSSNAFTPTHRILQTNFQGQPRQAAGSVEVAEDDE